MSEESYLVSARKYRPQLFGEIIAQQHVSETLKNAVRLDRLAHAYLFTGPRGVGKTTAARVLAKAINCTTPHDQRLDSAEPCRTCESCISFEQGRNLNIIEIDAASNNKVDDARDLRETVRIPPQGARMKVYIIDEVHMLTTQAFNALLKTLEEPPPHALFIFATTEPHKVPATIQSRCQRFDFRRIATTEIVSHLKTICEAESVRIDDESLMLIGRKGDGALRDSLSIFDQAVSLCGENIEFDELVRALGVVDTDLFFTVTDAVAESNVGAMFHVVAKIVSAGYDLQEFMDGLEEHFRHLLVTATIGVDGLLDITDEARVRLSAESNRFSESTLLRLIHIVGETSDRLKMARQPQLRLEMALVKMANLPATVDIRSALEKLDSLEKAVQKADLSAFRNRTEPSGINKTVAGKDSRTTRNSSETSAADIELKPEKQTGKKEAKDDEIINTEDAPEKLNTAGNLPDIKISRTESVAENASRAQVGNSVLDFGPPALKVSRTETPEKKASPENSLAITPAARGSSIATAESVGVADVAILEPEIGQQAAVAEIISPVVRKITEAWVEVIADTMEHHIRLGSLLRHSCVVKAIGEHVDIAVPDDFHKRMLLNEKSGLASMLCDKSGEPVHDLNFVVRPDLFETNESSSQEFDSRAFLKKKCEENPAIKELMERFGGEIVW